MFACSLGLDTLPCCANKQQWAWFHRYCAVIRTAQSFIQRTDLPKTFASIVREKIQNNLQEDETVSTEHENHDLFSKVKDEQLLNWLNRLDENLRYSVGINLLKVNNRSTRTRCEICSKLISGVFIVNFEHISHLI